MALDRERPGVEIVVFAGNGLKCPLTALAVRYGDREGVCV